MAKWVGDTFNRGIYDTHIELKKTPFLEWESPKQMDKLIANDLVNSSSSKLSYFYPITRVRSIERILRTTYHNAFLVVTPIKASSIPVLPKSVMKATPLLYTRPSISGSPDLEPLCTRYTVRNPIPEEYGDDDCVTDPLLEEDDICTSYTLPEHKKELGGESVCLSLSVCLSTSCTRLPKVVFIR